MDRALEDGRERDDENQERVNKLHTLLRPYLLRRMKADVEKELPGKYEHLVYCRLSKRQRFLYDEFMARAETKEILASGNFLSASYLFPISKHHAQWYTVRRRELPHAATKGLQPSRPLRGSAYRNLLCDDAFCYRGLRNKRAPRTEATPHSLAFRRHPSRVLPNHCSRRRIYHRIEHQAIPRLFTSSPTSQETPRRASTP